jgi:hypothetical protein
MEKNKKNILRNFTYDRITDGQKWVEIYSLMFLSIALKPVIKKNTLLLIDDTPLNPYWLDTRNSKVYDDMYNYYNKNDYLPGKGMYILNEINNAYKVIHNYQVLFKFYNSPLYTVEE